ncbi:TnsD family Tn7-like transposition protein [Burkholderia vietnamiensis]|uniref:TnsD family Tn7-like transposition protein n=1 Tax=Burkholderia vietnamiensis TaxID=60552 RepID=UPI000F800304|nr:TnsD family Tn7-like transposition protein [Burkholderia vietnamiensis]
MSIALFPLRDNETLESNFGRYAEFFGLKSTKWLRMQLFGYVGKPGIRLPNSISRLSEQAHDYWRMSAEDVVKNHTEYLYATRIASPSMREEVLRNMLHPPERGLSGRVSAYGQRCERIPGLRYCEECLAQWRDKRVEAYWKVNHQLPGVLYCDEHKIALKVVDQNVVDYDFGITIERCVGALDRVIIQPASQSELRAVMDIARLSVDQRTIDESIPLSRKYRDMLENAGFSRSRSTINRGALVSEWLAYFGPEYCHLTGINARRISAWLSNFEANSSVEKFSHPFIYVAAESFLENRILSIRSFVPARRRKLIPVRFRGENPPCLELPPCVGALHQDDDIYKASGYLFRSGGWKVVCSCGVAYRVLNVCVSEAATMIPFAYGVRYRTKFAELLKSGWSPKKAARELRLCATTGLLWARKSKPQHHGTISMAEIKNNRSEWRSLVDCAPRTMRIMSAQRANPRLYDLLNRNDHAWFSKFNRSHRSWRTKALFHVNGVDLEGERVRKAWSEIMQMEPPVRATRTAILDRAGLPLHLASETHALSPLWAELAETREAHRERVVSWLCTFSTKCHMRRGNNAINDAIRGTGLNMRSFTGEQKARIREFVSRSSKRDR